MADAVTKVTQEFPTKVIVHLTNVSDGTGESAVVKVDRSALTSPDNTAVQNLPIISARWAIQGFSSVKLLWDHATDDVAMVLSGNGYEEFLHGQRDPNTSGDAITGAIGDLLLTTVGATATATYDITLVVGKE